MFKKILIGVVLLLICVYIFFQHKTIIAKYSPGFRFEKYKTAEEAKTALLKLHPIGTSLDAFIKTIKNAGGELSYISKEDVNYLWGDQTAVFGAVRYYYSQTALPFSKKWKGACTYDESKNIQGLGIGKHCL